MSALHTWPDMPDLFFFLLFICFKLVKDSKSWGFKNNLCCNMLVYFVVVVVVSF